ncbi:DIM1 family protein (nucleomorph) [Chroomonas mesostigmatica CCMP1168]|uniref:DIM1 family protein n=1 Tax=Chroomonas mesostigmatica CCMP1168 TaxID=1195612 RepID=J7G9Z8_9CRYP|nr:DIM1 family protein [Chroomonas mesostigmatica CCMP1168]|mmetsp:Transcript_7795/g.19487  ORF Transcript_7795/g.19487 Transcript_7795/m.19487 type:complete len:136 (-) Transcript_7795:442-849(-)
MYDFAKNSKIVSAYVIDQILLDEKNKVIVLEFKKKIQSNVNFSKEYRYFLGKKFQKNFIFFSTEIETVFDFVQMYELVLFPTNIFFYRNKKILVDTGSGNNNKIENPCYLYRDFFSLLTKIFFGIQKGKTFVSSG